MTAALNAPRSLTAATPPIQNVPPGAVRARQSATRPERTPTVTLPPNPRGELRRVTIDGQPAVKLRCPGCGLWGQIDDDQLHGRVSVDHTDTGCTFHETRDWAATADWLALDAQ